MSNNIIQLINNEKHTVLTTPAGCGKTHLIAECVAKQPNRSLILTHTHAGVKAIRDKLKVLNVKNAKYSVETIASWSLKYSSSFPNLSQNTNNTPIGREWNECYKSAGRLLNYNAIINILQNSYSAVYIDEYQDCTITQHSLIMKLTEILPCKIFGDPLQGIFDFNEKIVDWKADIPNFFIPIEYPIKPWRWIYDNIALGEWLLEARKMILSNSPIDLGDAPIELYDDNPTNQINICRCFAEKYKTGIIAIHKMPPQAHSIASKLSGLFGSMEEVECKDLISWSEKMDRGTNIQKVQNVINFASICITSVPLSLKTITNRLETGDINFNRITKHRDIASTIIKFIDSGDFYYLAEILILIKKANIGKLYRKELWYEMIRSLKNYKQAGYSSLKDCAWHTRNYSRIIGRKIDNRAVSRILLIKGLEFKHAILLSTKHLKPKELYVALTRGSHTLAVLSSGSIIQYN
jgi:hypothetical protein